MVSASNTSVIFLLPWAAMWLLGGIWLSRSVFRVRPDEELLVGIALGWLLQNWLANLLAWILPVPLIFWLASILVFLAGGLACVQRGWRSLVRVPVRPVQMVFFSLVILVGFLIGRGLAIFDDFSHLSMVSLMAAGDMPPHFALDPAVPYGYHHFLQLFAAQMTRIGGLAPWVSLDAARALAFGLAVFLGGIWSQRVTRSQTAGLLAGFVLAFGSGMRWLLLFLPSKVNEILGRDIQMLGSGQASGISLADAMGNAWAVEGMGVIPFPFAFVNGILPPGVVQLFSANSLTFLAVVFLLLLTFNRMRGWAGAALTAALISTWGLLGEAELVALAVGSGLVLVGYLWSNRTLRLPASLWSWLGIAVGGCMIGVLQGGAWTDILLKLVYRISGQGAEASYQTIGFQLSAPAVVSSHLGVLSFFKPGTLLVGLLEIGPLLLVLPLLCIWGWKALRSRRWLEASLAAAAVFSLSMLCVQFTGSTGVRNTPRLYVFMPLLWAFSTPLVWTWASGRLPRIRVLAISLAVVASTGGIALFGIELVAMQRPVYSSFINALDARMARQFWNRLEPGTLIFDPLPYRAPALFGLPTDAYLTWYEPKPEWTALREVPDPVVLSQNGFGYIYLDDAYWEELGVQKQALLQKNCVELVQEWDNPQGEFRRLLDIQSCLD